MKFPKRVLLIVFSLFEVTTAFDLTLDTHKDTRKWKFRGNYKYTNSSLNEEVHQLRRVPESTFLNDNFDREGIWVIKHDPRPRKSNHWNMTYQLSHLLVAQSWVTLLAHPNVPVVFKSSDNLEIGRVWSDGKSWCDVVLDVGLRNTFTIEVRTPKKEEYVLIDKIVLGIMGNVTALNNKTVTNPCLTEPPTDLTPPDMERKEEDADNKLKRKVPEDEGVPDMEDKGETIRPSTPPPHPSSPGGQTSTRKFQTERGGAKCDCLCTCTKPTQSTNASVTLGHSSTTITPARRG